MEEGNKTLEELGFVKEKSRFEERYTRHVNTIEDFDDVIVFSNNRGKWISLDITMDENDFKTFIKKAKELGW